MDVPVSGQELFGGNIVRDLQAATLLANEVTRDTGAVAVERATQAALEIGHYDPRMFDADAAPAVIALAVELRAIFGDLGAGALDAGARRVALLLERHDVRLRLTNHANRPWHLHYRADAPAAVDALGAGCSAAMAYLIDADAAHRLRTCTAESCERAFVDLSRNSSRRFCSFECRNRTKTQAFRQRRAEAAELERMRDP